MNMPRLWPVAFLAEAGGACVCLLAGQRKHALQVRAAPVLGAYRFGRRLPTHREGLSFPLRLCYTARAEPLSAAVVPWGVPTRGSTPAIFCESLRHAAALGMAAARVGQPTGCMRLP
jgi:hypothetical protein